MHPQPDTHEARLVEPALIGFGLGLPALIALIAIVGDFLVAPDFARTLLVLLVFASPLAAVGAALAAVVRAGLLLRSEGRQRTAALLFGWLAVAAVWAWLWGRTVSAF